MSEQRESDPADAKAGATRSGIVAYLQVEGARKAAAFYERAFGAEIAGSQPDDAQGRTMHVHLYVNGASLMLSDPFPEYGHPFRPAQGYSLLLPVDDIVAWWTRAVEAGAEVVTPYQTMFWGDVYGQLRDPFGVTWALNQSSA